MTKRWYEIVRAAGMEVIIKSMNGADYSHEILFYNPDYIGVWVAHHIQEKQLLTMTEKQIMSWAIDARLETEIAHYKQVLRHEPVLP